VAVGVDQTDVSLSPRVVADALSIRVAQVVRLIEESPVRIEGFHPARPEDAASRHPALFPLEPAGFREQQPFLAPPIRADSRQVRGRLALQNEGQGGYSWVSRG